MQLRTPDQIELDALRAEATILLDQCSEKQRIFFSKIYPAGTETMDRPNLRSVIGLCQRTIRQNLTGDMHASIEHL